MAKTETKEELHLAAALATTATADPDNETVEEAHLRIVASFAAEVQFEELKLASAKDESISHEARSSSKRASGITSAGSEAPKSKRSRIEGDAKNNTSSPVKSPGAHVF